MATIERKLHTIDATGKPVGRLASEIARLLQGKHKATYVPNADLGDAVEVTNIRQVTFSGKKFEQKVYKHHTGYLGGLKTVSLATLFERAPDEVLRRAVKQMLPKNRLLEGRMKRLVIKA